MYFSLGYHKSQHSFIGFFFTVCSLFKWVVQHRGGVMEKKNIWGSFKNLLNHAQALVNCMLDLQKKL